MTSENSLVSASPQMGEASGSKSDRPEVIAEVQLQHTPEIQAATQSKGEVSQIQLMKEDGEKANQPKTWSVIDGRPIVTLEHSEIVKQTEEWRNALVLYVIGETPNFSYMSSYIARNWNSVATPDIYLHDDGFYIVKFKNIHDRDEILYSEPYTVNSMPMILKVWSSDFDFK
uniref:Uncharacterized protein LOC104221364 n=1 Tax=Nicotiana sylvestris TaxID=4096 RepID=A0A1U7W902_NICSY|nr:PREDICTED: uncharacterized protein LOC104221364 [Nicotiana sylvestris]